MANNLQMTFHIDFRKAKNKVFFMSSQDVFFRNPTSQDQEHVDLTKEASQSIRNQDILYLHHGYIVTLSDGRDSIKLYDNVENVFNFTAEMKFEGKILNTHLSDDKKELYVLTQKSRKESAQNALTPEKIEACKASIADFYKNPDDMKLDALFQLFDLNGRGVISKSDFKDVMTSICGEVGQEAEIDLMFSYADIHNRGLFKPELQHVMQANDLLSWMLHATDEIAVHVLNFKKLSTHEIYRTNGGYTKLGVVGNNLILFNRLNCSIRTIPFQHLMDKRFYTFARNLKNKPDEITSDPMFRQFKDIIIHPSYLDLTHFCTYYKAYDALKQLMGQGNKITETTDKTSALSILLRENQKDKLELDVINHTVNYIMEDEILKDMDIYVQQTAAKIKIAQHLKPVQHSLKDLNEKTRIPSLCSIYTYGFMMIEPGNIQIDKEVEDTGHTLRPQKQNHKSTIKQNVQYSVSAIKYDMDVKGDEAQSIIDTALHKDNQKVLNSDVIRLFTNICWRQAQRYVTLFGLSYLCFTILMTYHIIQLRDQDIDESDQFWVVIALLIFQAFCWSCLFYEIYKEKISYFTKLWKIVEIFASVFTTYYLVSYVSGRDTNPIILALANWFIWWRLISFVRVIDRVRYYIRMIQEIIKGMGPFLLILVLCIFAQSFGLMALRQEESYEAYFMIAYRLMYGDFEEEHLTHEERSYFIFTSLMITLVMLNLIIAIMGDLFDEFQTKFEIHDIKERLELMREIGKFFGYFHKQSRRSYIHWITSDLIIENRGETATWDGRVNEIRRQVIHSVTEQLDRQTEEMTQRLEMQRREITEKLEKQKEDMNELLEKQRRDIQADIISILDSRLGIPTEEEPPNLEFTKQDSIMAFKHEKSGLYTIVENDELIESVVSQSTYGQHVVHALGQVLHVYDITLQSAKQIAIPMKTPGDAHMTWVTISPSVVMLMGIQSYNDEGYQGCAYVNLHTEDFTSKSNMLSPVWAQNPVYYQDQVWLFFITENQLSQIYSCKKNKWTLLPKPADIEEYFIYQACEINGTFWLYGYLTEDFYIFNPQTRKYKMLKNCNLTKTMQKIIIKKPNSFVILYREGEGFEYDLHGCKIQGGYPEWKQGIEPQGEAIQYENKTYFSTIFTRYVYEFDSKTKTIQVVYEF